MIIPQNLLKYIFSFPCTKLQFTSYIALYTWSWFNIKMPSYQYRKSHCGDKTVVRSFYIHNGISFTGKMSSLYWIGALITSKVVYDVAHVMFCIVYSSESFFIIPLQGYFTNYSELHWKWIFSLLCTNTHFTSHIALHTWLPAKHSASKHP